MRRATLAVSAKQRAYAIPNESANDANVVTTSLPLR